MVRKFIAPVMVVILGFSFMENAFARPHRGRELSTFEQVVIGVGVTAIILNVLTKPSQPTIVLPPSNDSTFGTGTYGGAAPTISAVEAEFKKIMPTLEAATYITNEYRPQQGYMHFVSQSGNSEILVTLKQLSLRTVPDYGKGNVKERVTQAGFEPKDISKGAMVFLGDQGFLIFVYIIK